MTICTNNSKRKFKNMKPWIIIAECAAGSFGTIGNGWDSIQESIDELSSLVNTRSNKVLVSIYLRGLECFEQNKDAIIAGLPENIKSRVDQYRAKNEEIGATFGIFEFNKAIYLSGVTFRAIEGVQPHDLMGLQSQGV